MSRAKEGKAGPELAAAAQARRRPSRRVSSPVHLHSQAIVVVKDFVNARASSSSQQSMRWSSGAGQDAPLPVIATATAPASRAFRAASTVNESPPR